MSIFKTQKPSRALGHQPEGLERLIFRKKHRSYEKFYVHMFLQDISRIVPYRTDNREDSLFAVSSNNPELADKAIRALGSRHRSEKNDTLRSFLERAAQTLTIDKKAIYYFESEIEGENISCDLWHLDPAYIFGLFGVYFQFLPRQSGPRWHEDAADNNRIRRLDGSRMIILRLPFLYRHRMRQTVAKLAKLSDWRYPDLSMLFSQVTLENPNPKAGPFNFQAFQKKLDIAVFRTINWTGWNARQSDGALQSDFFTCIRMLRFKRFQVSIRDAILKQLSSQVQAAMRQHDPNFVFEITAENLFTYQKIDQMALDLQAGNLSFSDLIKLCFKF